MQTRVVATDIYGTILAHDDPENSLPPRYGFIAFAKKCRSLSIPLVSCSDNDIVLTKIDLEESSVPLELFDDFFQMLKGVAKDFSPVLTKYKISPEELLVIGDNLEIDLRQAEKAGCQTHLVPSYDGQGYDRREPFDFSKVVIF